MIAVARAHDDGSGTLTLGGTTNTVTTDSLEEAMAELIALVVDHARVTGRDVELVAHASGTRTGLRIDPDGGIVEDDRILAASLSRTRQLEDHNAAGKSTRRRRGRTRADSAATAPATAPTTATEPLGIEDLFPAASGAGEVVDEPAVDEPLVDEPAVDEPLVDQPDSDGPEPGPDRSRPRPRRRAAAAAAAGAASAPSAASQALQATRTRVLAVLPPRSSAAKSARVLLASAAVAALLGGAGYVAVNSGDSKGPGTAPTTTAPVGSASSSGTPSPTAPTPTTAAVPLAPAKVVALSRAPGRIVLAVGGLKAGERVTITVRAKNGKVRTLTRVVTTSPLRWTLTKLASGTARWRVEVPGHRDATGTVRVKATPPPPPPAPANPDPAPQPDPDPAPQPDPPSGGGGGGGNGGGGGGGGGGPVDPATQLPGPVG